MKVQANTGTGGDLGVDIDESSGLSRKSEIIDNLVEKNGSKM